MCLLPCLDLKLYAFPPVKLNSDSAVQGEGEQGTYPTRSPVLAVSDVVLGADFSSRSPSYFSDQKSSAICQLQGKI